MQKFYYSLFYYGWDIRDALAGNMRTFSLYCQGPCKNIDAVLDVDSGDAELFAQEDDFPNFEVTQKYVQLNG